MEEKRLRGSSVLKSPGLASIWVPSVGRRGERESKIALEESNPSRPVARSTNADFCLVALQGVSLGRNQREWVAPVFLVCIVGGGGAATHWPYLSPFCPTHLPQVQCIYTSPVARLPRDQLAEERADLNQGEGRP